ncbi:MAG: hypothetical protein HC888_18160 [Candidatus Competibacteraceae bacterium]|nr:hypothetical protein [Candidatus Competibacteraceae bacterium]
MAYLGTLLDDDFRTLLSQGRFADWLDRAHKSYLPLLDSDRVHIGFDFATEYEPHSVEWSWCLMLQSHLRSRGRECVIESLPRADREDQRAFFGLCTEGFWQEQVVTGRIRVASPRGGVRWWTNHADQQQYYGRDVRRWIADCYAHGLHPCMDWRLIKKYQLTAADMASFDLRQNAMDSR